MDVGVSQPMASAYTELERTTDFLPIQVDEIADDGIWADLLARAVVAHLPQSRGYGYAKNAKGWRVRRIAFREGEQIVAVASVLERRALGVRLVARVNRGPLLLDAALSPQTIIGIYAALRQRWRGPLLIAPALLHGPDSSRLLREAGFRLRHDRGWQSARIDLSAVEAQLWAGFSSGFRNRVRQGEKANAIVRVSSETNGYEWLLDRHVANMRDKGFKGADPVFLRALRNFAPEDVVVLQLEHAGALVAGMSVVQFGDCAEYHVGWFGAEGRRINAGNVLMWSAIREMQRRGVRQFDVGGLREGDGYTQFKRTMRPVEFRLAGEWMSF